MTSPPVSRLIESAARLSLWTAAVLLTGFQMFLVVNGTARVEGGQPPNDAAAQTPNVPAVATLDPARCLHLWLREGELLPLHASLPANVEFMLVLHNEARGTRSLRLVTDGAAAETIVVDPGVLNKTLKLARGTWRLYDVDDERQAVDVSVH